MRILDGKKIASQIKEELKAKITQLGKKNITPGLAVILVGNDAASEVYVNSKKRACEDVGIYSKVLRMPGNTTQKELQRAVEKLNSDKKIHGILVQLPLPRNIDEEAIIESIIPEKDVDCFHPYNAGRLSIGMERFLPCTPAGIIKILERSNIDISGKECLVVGRSNIVGKPMAAMFLNKNGTVTIAHSKTKNLAEITKRADILVAAVGKAGLIKKDMVKNGAVIIDVGMNRLPNGKLVGDVDFDQVKEVVSAITPVPGGVGPMTIAMLLENTIKAAKKSYENRS